MAMQKQPVLSVSGLQKSVHGRLIVKDVSFDVYPGEIFGFLGPNGAGKTTTIRMLVGLIRPTAGMIKIAGQDMTVNPLKAMQNVGCIVENPDLYPYLSGYENLLQLAKMQGKHAVERIAGVAQLVHLTDRLADKVGTYSLGMRQRLGIAQALLCNPKLLILDEPTNGLDPAGIRELRIFLQELAHAGMSVFISSHLLAEIELLCDTVAIIRDGVVIETGQVSTLLAKASTQVHWRTAVTTTSSDEVLAILQRNAAVEKSVERTATGNYRCDMSDVQVAAATTELVHAGIHIYEIARHKATLEDVFLDTTGGQ